VLHSTREVTPRAAEAIESLCLRQCFGAKYTSKSPSRTIDVDPRPDRSMRVAAGTPFQSQNWFEFLIRSPCILSNLPASPILLGVTCFAIFLHLLRACDSMPSHLPDGPFFADIYKRRKLWLQSRELDRKKRLMKELRKEIGLNLRSWNQSRRD
jgi:hypothetical protein